MRLPRPPAIMTVHILLLFKLIYNQSHMKSQDSNTAAFLPKPENIGFDQAQTLEFSLNV